MSPPRAPRPFFSWRQAVLHSALPATTKLVLLVLGCHMNDAGESCYPSTRTLANECGLSRQAVMEHLDRAREAGWVRVSRHGFGGQIWRRNEYAIAWPPEKVVNQDDHEVVNQDDLSPSIDNSSEEAAHAIARRIFGDLQKLNPTHREPHWASWKKDVAKMLAEGRSAKEILELWEFAHGHSFWKKNVLSPAALRRHFDRLTILRSSTESSSARKPDEARCSANENGERCRNRATVRRGAGPWLCSAHAEKVLA